MAKTRFRGLQRRFGSYTIYCSGTWFGEHANGTVTTPNITVPVVAPTPVGTPGIVNPKYVVVGVTYAPPGPSSYVQYTGTTNVGDTINPSKFF